MFDWLYQGLGYVIRFCYSLTNNNYVIALFLFALVVKVVLFPFGIKQQKNMVKQAKLRPREMAIRKKYAGRNDQKTQQKQQEEIMALYQEENFNPMGGCLPLLIQFPILIALYRVITQPLTYICQFSSETVAAINAKIAEFMSAGGSEAITKATKGYSAEITTITQMKEIGLENFASIEGFSAQVIPNFEIFSGALNLSYTPSIKNLSWLVLIPILTLVFTLLSTRITKKLSYQAPSTQDMANNPSMKIMEYSMPLLSTYICFTVPAAIGVYWIYQNVLSILQQFVLFKLYPYPKFTEEDYKAAEKAVGADKKEKKKSTTASSGTKGRSLHHIDDDEFEEIYGKKNTKKENKTEEVKENKIEEAKKAEEIKEEIENKDIPQIKDDSKTKYKKKD